MRPRRLTVRTGPLATLAEVENITSAWVHSASRPLTRNEGRTRPGTLQQYISTVLEKHLV